MRSSRGSAPTRISGNACSAASDGIYTVQREKTTIDGFEFRATWHASAADTVGLRYASTDGRYDSNNDGHVDTDLSGANIGPDRVNASWDRAWSRIVTSRLQVNHLLNRTFKDITGATYNRFDGYTTVDLGADVQAFSGVITAAARTSRTRITSPTTRRRVRSTCATSRGWGARFA